MSTERQLHLCLNMPHPGVGWNSARDWTPPERTPGSEVDEYVRLAQSAERGLFDAVFLADVPRLRAQIAQRPVQSFEPTILLAAIARATRNIGLVATLSTTYNEPYNVARRIQSLDVVSDGRTAWNAVTTWDPVASANFGTTTQLPREVRYARAAEFVDIVRALWGSWDADAIIEDRANGVYANVDRIRPISYSGDYLSVHGPLTLPPSRQGTPLVFQAGGSEQGRDLAARSADAVFSAVGTLDAAVEDARDVRARADRAGRDGRAIRILPGLRTVLGSSDEEAREKRHFAATEEERAAELEQLAAVLLVPTSALDFDEPVPRELLSELPTELPFPIGFHRAVRARALEGKPVSEILRSGGLSGHLEIVGSPERVADVIETWYRAGAADGFNIMPHDADVDFELFVDHVVPLLQQKGIYRTAYETTTLREHFGLAAPATPNQPDPASA